MASRTLLLTGIALLGATACLAEPPEPMSAFLLEQKTITTKAGVIGVAAGTRVVVVARHGDTLTVRANDQEFEVASDQVTTDAEAARKLLQQQQQQDMLEREATERELQYKERLLTEQNAKQEQAKRKIPGPTAAERQLEEVHGKRERLKTELNKIKVEQTGLVPADTSTKARQKARQRRKEIEHELTELDRQERLLKHLSH